MNNCRNCDAGHGDRRLRKRFPCGRGSSWRPRPGRVTLEVAEELGTTRATVGKWRRRFLLDGCDGVLDEPRPGSPRKIGDDEAERVVVKTLESLPRDATHWSTRSMVKECGMRSMAMTRSRSTRSCVK